MSGRFEKREAFREFVAVVPGDDKRVQEFIRMLTACEHRLDSYVLALVPNWADAEDIVQQTKLKLWEQFEHYERDKDFGAWACTIAYYEVLTFRARTNRSHLLFSETAIQRVSKEAAEIVAESGMRFNRLQQCIEKLTPWQRELLWRCCAASESIKDVALELHRKVDATRKALLRIRRELYRCVNGSSGEEAKP